MTSTERVMEYSRLEQEPQGNEGTLEVPVNWPKYGIITFERVYYAHHPTMPYVLKNLNLCIRSEEKVPFDPSNILQSRDCLACIFLWWSASRRQAASLCYTFLNSLPPRVKPWVIQSFLTFNSMEKSVTIHWKAVE